MAFLDNSGDIILDAVLTEIGRKRMANGNFRIVKFGLGDDEINYEKYTDLTDSKRGFFKSPNFLETSFSINFNSCLI